MQKRHIASAICLVAMLILTAGICVIIWRKTSGEERNPMIPESLKFVNLSRSATLEISQSQIILNFRELEDQDNIAQQVYLGTGINNTDIITSNTWVDQEYLHFQWADYNDMNLTIQNLFVESGMNCVNVQWKMARTISETPRDCFEMKSSFWFGGYEEAYQYWPINKGNISTAPFVTGDGYQAHNIGDVIEGLFFSSAGVGIYVYENSSLYLSVNENNSKMLCISGKVGNDTPYFNTHNEAIQIYDVCHASDITSLWKKMTHRYLARPNGTPSGDVLRYPIWSTWARYKGFVNQTDVLEFAREIKDNSFEISQLELDDNWTPKYGDFIFDTTKFKDTRNMISNLTHLGIPLTVWVHPFFNNDSKAFVELDGLGLLVKSTATNESAMTTWWRGQHAGILDVTNPDAVRWYLDKMDYLQENYNITSFKFDAGESNFLPKGFKVKHSMKTPNEFSQLYAQLAFKSDTTQRRQEIRVGFRSQELPVLVRMIDRDSSWGHDKGIRTLIPCALTMGLMGYPFVLPDMVGGNAYDPVDLDKTVLPDPELFVRWLQATALMPAVQFSIPPWFYNSTIVSISKKFTSMHESFADKIIGLATNAAERGEPIIRPIWWLAPHDVQALQIESEFLLGDEVLVAPVLEKGAVSRDVYLPKGRWRDDSGTTYPHKVFLGPTWLKDFPAGLDVLPHFTRVHF